MTRLQLNRRLKIGVLGCGHMGAAIIRGLADRSFHPQNVLVFDPDARAVRALKKDVNVRAVKSARQAVSVADAVILAVKPQVMGPLLEEIGLSTPRQTLVLSIAAGVRLAALQKAFKEKVGVIRVMPNMPAQVGEGMSAYAAGTHVNAAQIKIAEAILTAVGEAVPVKEADMDLVTALSGSGPAYFFLLCETLIEAGCEMGLKSAVAKRLVYQTALGSARALVERGDDPDVLIAQVASRRGTTEEALKVFRRKGFAKIVRDAVAAACRRSRELSRPE